MNEFARRKAIVEVGGIFALTIGREEHSGRGRMLLSCLLDDCI